MAVALIFAGGTGKRMNSRSKPKQFVEMHGKPIIIYTLEHFEYHDEVDSITVVCLKDWIEELQGLLKRYDIRKVKTIVPGGETGHDSICLGLEAMKDYVPENEIVLIHDGVRPMINKELITQNIKETEKYGNSITAEPVCESIIRSKDGEEVIDVPPRKEMYAAKAPQTFHYGEILKLYEKAKEDGIKSIDSSHLCSIYHQTLHMVVSTRNNIKITEPADFYIYRALYEAMENQQIYGL